MPIETLDRRDQSEQRQKLPLDHVVMAKVMTFPVRKDQVIRV
jgi:hypothetical protein